MDLLLADDDLAPPPDRTLGTLDFPLGTSTCTLQADSWRFGRWASGGSSLPHPVGKSVEGDPAAASPLQRRGDRVPRRLVPHHRPRRQRRCPDRGVRVLAPRGWAPRAQRTRSVRQRWSGRAPREQPVQVSARARIRVPALTLCATALLSACGSTPPAPREARLDGGGASSPVRSVEGVVGSELTLAEIRTGFVEPRCAEAGAGDGHAQGEPPARWVPDGDGALRAGVSLANTPLPRRASWPIYGGRRFALSTDSCRHRPVAML